jgi:hypothetical protein
MAVAIDTEILLQRTWIFQFYASAHIIIQYIVTKREIVYSSMLVRLTPIGVSLNKIATVLVVSTWEQENVIYHSSVHAVWWQTWEFWNLHLWRLVLL